MTPEHPSNIQPVILGAGPAGLTAAYELTKSGITPVVLEKQDIVGGLSSTRTYKGFYFDMGGHRFFTKAEEVKKLWQEVLGNEFLKRPRMSRIYYNGKFFAYPLKPMNALFGLGIWQSIMVVLSYVRWQVFPYRQEETFEQWVTNRFGRRLFLTFFKSYTEKVWGIPCSELKAEWAAQRIKDLSLKTALVSMFLKPKTTITTLIEEFDYPRLGPGMMWNAVRDEVERRRGVVQTDTDVVRINRTGNRVDSVVAVRDGREEIVQGTDFISSMPVTEFVSKVHPPAPKDVLAAAAKLTYRDFLTVVLIVNRPQIFDDNWIYIHDPEVSVGRIQNFKNWSPDMVPDPGKTSLGLEYFCTEGDTVWTTPDDKLIAQAKREVGKLGLVQAADVEDGCVVRVPKAYPVYDSAYGDHLAVVRTFVEGLENFQTIGRNGLHRYNNQDHAMITGMIAARNVSLGQRADVWSVNTDAEYHEEIRESADGQLEEALEQVLSEVFLKLDRVALGLSLGMASGALLFLATVALLLKGGATVGPTLGLIGQFFPGYSVTPAGSLLGLVYGFVTGFVAGWTFGLLKNATTFFYAALVYRRAEFRAMRRILEFL
jgi:protoporphyrinogen oxidase